MNDTHDNATLLTGPELWEIGYVDGVNGRSMRRPHERSPQYRSGWHTGRNA